MNSYTIKEISITNNRIVCRYEVAGDWTEYFSSQRETYIEYSVNECLIDIPKSVLVIPFIANILPAAWIADAEINVKEIDSDFFNHIDEIKNGYREMYPSFQFLGRIVFDNIENNSRIYRQLSPDNELPSGASFFSGGVDAYTTLFRNFSTIDHLLTLWGADVKLDDTIGWNNVWKCVMEAAKEYKKQAIMIKSDFRHVLNESKLDYLVRESKDGWWHGFQHGISIITHAAPLAYIYGYKKVYIASSFPASMKGQYTCASDPCIDEHVHFCGCKIIHDGYEMDRQEKIRYCIQEKRKNGKKIEFHVCWESRGGKNCSSCEKCYRTILELVSEGENPNEYGFAWNRGKIKKCKLDYRRYIRIPDYNIQQFYFSIQERIKENQKIVTNYNDYKWLVNMDFSKLNCFPIKRFINSKYYNIIRNIKAKLKG